MKRLTPEQRKECRDMYLAGLEVNAIAERLQLPRLLVHRALMSSQAYMLRGGFRGEDRS